MSSLFDKIIDIELVDTSGKVTRIVTPRTGMKPNITVSGTLSANTIQGGLLKITNFYPDKPLNTGNQQDTVYKWLRINAGYASGEMGVIEGQSFLAYTESPGPDGVSVITFFTGPMTVWTTSIVNTNWPEGTPFNTVLSDLANILKKNTTLDIQPKSFISESVVVEAPGLIVSGTCSDLIQKVKDAYGISIYPEGMSLVMCDTYLGKTDEYVLNYVKSIKKTAAGYTVTAPWIPALRQHDTLVIDSKYYTVENFGAMGVSFKTKFRVINVSFEFSTVDETNSMTVLCVGFRNDTTGRRVVPGRSTIR